MPVPSQAGREIGHLSDHRRRRFRRAAADEDGQVGEHLLLRWVEQGVAPADGGAHGALSLRQMDGSGGEQAERAALLAG